MQVIAKRGPRLEGIAAATSYVNLVVFGMDVGFHIMSPQYQSLAANAEARRPHARKGCAFYPSMCSLPSVALKLILWIASRLAFRQARESGVSAARNLEPRIGS